jgi:hypothetical protein
MVEAHSCEITSRGDPRTAVPDVSRPLPARRNCLETAEKLPFNPARTVRVADSHWMDLGAAVRLASSAGRPADQTER